MKGLGVFFVATLTVLVGSLVLIKAATGQSAAVSRRCVTIGTTSTCNPAAFREAAARFRRCDPHHWRLCLLQH